MLTQGELAEKSGVGITSIVRIERDQLDTSPRLDAAEAGRSPGR